CRRRGSLEHPEEVFLDQNELAKGEKFFAVGDWEVSDDGNLLAYTTDVTGFREYTLFVRDLRSGKTGVERIPKVSSLAWAADNRTIFYVIDDAAKRPYRLYRHVVGADVGTDALVYEEKDERFTVEVSRSRSGSYVFANVSSHTSGEIRYVAADRPTAAFSVVAPREKDREYDVDHRGDLFYIRVNDTGRNFRLVTAPVANPQPANWKEMVPHREDVMLEGPDLFAGHLVLYERVEGLRRFRVTDLASNTSHSIDFPEPVYAAFSGDNREFDTKTFRFRYQSLITPESVFDYDMSTRARKLLKQTEVLGGYDPSRYVSERLRARASDGTIVPISIVYRKG